MKKIKTVKKSKTPVSKSIHQEKEEGKNKEPGRVNLDVNVYQTGSAQIKAGESLVSSDMSRLVKPSDKRKKRKRKKEVLKLKAEKSKRKKAKIQTSVDPAKVEQEKRLIMWVGVSFFLVLIIFFWFLGIKYVFKQTSDKESDRSALQQLGNVSDQFSQAIQEMKKGLAEIKSEIDIGTNSAESIIEDEQVSAQERPLLFTEEDIEDLKEALGKIHSENTNIVPE